MSPDILTAGSWVVVRGVARWVPDPPPPVLELVPDEDAGCRQTVSTFADLIACPTCGAKVTERCKRESGVANKPHAARLAPRLCVCGELPGRFSTYCGFCRAQNRKRTRVEYATRKRDAA